MKAIKVYLTEKQLAKLKTISEKTAAPVAALIRKAIDAYLKGRK